MAQRPSAAFFDGQGTLFCTTYAGASSTRGSVVELIRHAHEWQEKTIYVFKGGSDGGNLNSGLAMDASGALYGTPPTRLPAEMGRSLTNPEFEWNLDQNDSSHLYRRQ
jgi:hypothetical protein